MNAGVVLVWTQEGSTRCLRSIIISISIIIIIIIIIISSSSSSIMISSSSSSSSSIIIISAASGLCAPRRRPRPRYKSGRLEMMIWCDDLWQFPNQVVVVCR